MTKQQEQAIARVCAHECLMGELVEALKEALHELEAYCFDESGEHYNNPRINAVLQKATGEAA